jgi:hypothetical protein
MKCQRHDHPARRTHQAAADSRQRRSSDRSSGVAGGAGGLTAHLPDCCRAAARRRARSGRRRGRTGARAAAAIVRQRGGLGAALHNPAGQRDADRLGFLRRKSIIRRRQAFETFASRLIAEAVKAGQVNEGVDIAWLTYCVYATTNFIYTWYRRVATSSPGAGRPIRRIRPGWHCRIGSC